MKSLRIPILLMFPMVFQSCIMLRSKHEFQIAELHAMCSDRDSIFQDSLSNIALSIDSLSIAHEAAQIKYDSLLQLKLHNDYVLSNYYDSLNSVDSTTRVRIDSIAILRLQVSDLKTTNYKLNQDIASTRKASEKSKPTPSNSRNRSFSIVHGSNKYDVYIEPDAGKIAMDWKGSKGNKLRSIGRLLQEHDSKIKFVTNGGMYLEDGSPQGLYIEDGREYSPIDTESNQYGNFYLLPNGIFGLTADGAFVLDTKAYQEMKPKNVRYATQSGPMLVIEGEIHPKFTKGSKNLHIRSGVGVTKDGTMIFAISNHLVNFYDFASLFRDKYGCKNALYLDGAICQSYLPEIKRIDSTGNFGVMIFGVE
jgi:uncharacterized protein YigE (DUF2233 family)